MNSQRLKKNTQKNLCLFVHPDDISQNRCDDVQLHNTLNHLIIQQDTLLHCSSPLQLKNHYCIMLVEMEDGHITEPLNE